MDAMIMDGRDLSSGAVACVSTALHPVSLARGVMEQTEHCMIVGEGADRLAALQYTKSPNITLITTAAQPQP